MYHQEGWSAHKDLIQEVILDESLQTLSAFAFSSNNINDCYKSLTAVLAMNGVEIIDNDAFQDSSLNMTLKAIAVWDGHSSAVAAMTIRSATESSR